MQNRLQLTGYVLHKRPYRETSLLVDFFTLELGRLSAVAKGARGSGKSDRKSLLQGFQKLEFILSGRSNLKNLGALEAKENAITLEKTALYCAFYINEVLSRALPEAEANPVLFSIYERSLHALKAVPIDDKNPNLSLFEPILRDFEFNLLQALGYLPDFEFDALSGEAISLDKYYKYDPQSGFEPCFADYKYALSGAHLAAIADQDYQNEHKRDVLKAAKYISRLALIELIGVKPIKSRELFR